MLTAVRAAGHGAPAVSAAEAPQLATAEPGRLLVEHDVFVAGLSCRAQAKYLRRRGAQRLLAAHPDLQQWMGRPVADRLAEAHRLGAWPFLSWCFATRALVPDLELLTGKARGIHFTTWARLHPGDTERALAAARELGWCPEYVTRVGVGALALVCLTRAVTLDELTAADLDTVATTIEDSPLIPGATRKHLRAEQHSLAMLCYQLAVIDTPPHHGNLRQISIAQRVADITQPRIRELVTRYLHTIATTLRPKTIEGRAASLRVFTGWLARNHPEVDTLTQLRRAHLEAFLIFNATRVSHGRVRHGQPISVRHHHRTVHDLRLFFDDLVAWTWAERPTSVLVHRWDIPRLPAPLPRALAPDVDTALMAAVTALDDPAARAGITVLRGAGLRLGELRELALDCLWDLPGHGTWLKVPLGKLNTERVVPLDAPTLDALDAWMQIRGRQRALPHPRDGRPTDFLLAIGGQRVGASRIRRGLDQATATAGLSDRAGTALHITPHQLRHTYATSLINAGMSLQALMALLGHVTPEMTLRYAALADTTVRAAYDTAITKIRSRRELPLVISGRPVVPDRVAWLRTEMLKTRVAHGYCSRHLAAQACPYANICEQCDNFTTSTEFLPQLHAQLTDEITLREDAQARGWDSEVARHARVITSLQRHLTRLKSPAPTAGA